MPFPLCIVLQSTSDWLLPLFNHWNCSSQGYQWVTFTKSTLRDLVVAFSVVEHFSAHSLAFLSLWDTWSSCFFLPHTLSYFFRGFSPLPASKYWHIPEFSPGLFSLIVLNSFPMWSHSTYCLKYGVHVDNSQVYISGLHFLLEPQTHYSVACLILPLSYLNRCYLNRLNISKIEPFSPYCSCPSLPHLSNWNLGVTPESSWSRIPQIYSIIRFSWSPNYHFNLSPISQLHFYQPSLSHHHLMGLLK